jgi:hypothetical protein
VAWLVARPAESLVIVPKLDRSIINQAVECDTEHFADVLEDGTQSVIAGLMDWPGLSLNS